MDVGPPVPVDMRSAAVAGRAARSNAMLRTGKLPTTVTAKCGTINHDDGQGTGRMNVDGSKCSREASRFVTDGESGVELLTCGHHVERAKERFDEAAA